MPLVFFVGLICVLIIGGIAFAVWRRQLREKRMMELAMWAEANGFSFRATVDRSMHWRFRDFRCLQRGDDRYGYNIIEGAIGARPVCAFDYHYETHSTGSKGQRQTHHHHMSALVVEAGLPLKPLFIRPEGFLDQLAEFIGFDDIDFESAEFSKRFLVKSPDRRWAYDVLHQKTMELMLAYPSFTLDFQGSQIMAYRDNKRLSTGEFSAALQLITGILDNLPESVVRELKGIDAEVRLP
jgi:hypothetical protein